MSKLETSEVRSSIADPVVDEVALRAMVDGDQALLKELVLLFADEFPISLAKIRAAVDTGNAKALENAAHALKGCVSNFSAQAAVGSALKLEMLGREGNIDGAAETYVLLEEQLTILLQRLQAIAVIGLT